MTNVTTPAPPAPPAPPAEPAGTTPRGLFDALWPGAEIDVYVSRDLDARHFGIGAGWNDTVWVEAPGAPPVCYFRLTPGRMLGLAAKLQARRAKLAAAEATRADMTPAGAAALDARVAMVEREAAILKTLKAEFKARWPEVVKRFDQIVPEDIEEPARASDAWAVAREAETQPVAAAPPPAPADAELAAWAAAAAVPAGAFRPTDYSVVLDGPAWLARLRVRAAGDAAAARAAALDRLRRLRAAAPPPASADEEATARTLAARA